MNQTSNQPQGGQDNSEKATSYEDLKLAMMQQMDKASDALDTDPAPTTAGAPDPVETPTAAATPEPVPEEAPQASIIDDEESVEDYMNRLLNRSSTDNVPTEPKPTESKTVEPTAKQTETSKQLLEKTFAADLEARENELRPVTLTKATLPELEASFLTEMRTVSRQSADFAINDCAKRKYKSLASVQLGVGATLIGFGLLQNLVAPGMLGTTAVILPCYAVAIYFLLKYTQWRNLTRSVDKDKIAPVN